MPKLYIKNSRYFKYLMITMAVIAAVTLIVLFSVRYSFAAVFITVCIVILAVSCILEAVILIIAAIYELIQLIKKAIGIRK